jgi:hypothetical protein
MTLEFSNFDPQDLNAAMAEASAFAESEVAESSTAESTAVKTPEPETVSPAERTTDMLLRVAQNDRAGIVTRIEQTEGEITAIEQQMETLYLSLMHHKVDLADQQRALAACDTMLIKLNEPSWMQR